MGLTMTPRAASDPGHLALTPQALFITGTDTGVGKTRAAAALCRAFAARGALVAAMKPVASGCTLTPAGLRNDDALALLGAMNVRAEYSTVNPYAFAPAIAPHIAAREAGVDIDFGVLDRAYERLRMVSEMLIVEGAGGWLAPLDAARGFADLALGLPDSCTADSRIHRAPRSAPARLGRKFHRSPVRTPRGKPCHPAEPDFGTLLGIFSVRSPSRARDSDTGPCAPCTGGLS
jgi:dethiobiotin synthase